MPPIKIYMTRTCPFCTMACRLLDSKGAVYETIDIGSNAQKWADLEAMTGRNTVPQIYIGEQHVGGYDDLSASDRKGELDKLLNNTF